MDIFGLLATITISYNKITIEPFERETATDAVRKIFSA